MLDHAEPLKKLASCAMCCLAAAAAVAGPPPSGGPSGLLGRASGLLAAAPSHSAAGHLDFQKLDLRAPDAVAGGHASAAIGGGSVESFQSVFPSARRAQPITPGGAEDLPGGANVATLRMESKVQELERRVPREGLPVARLWETKTALLHVGLSPRGKPGLWLIQKIP